jgi:radical SAM-linked protein
MKVQRLRVRFSRGEEVKFVTHLDLMRLWERTLRRAKIDVAYSEGFTPHAQLSLAAPLAVGVTSDGELLDVFLADRLTPLEFMREIGKQLPGGIEALEVEEVGLRAPSLQGELRAAEYEVSLAATLEQANAREAVESFLAAESVPWEQMRDGELRRYDIRAMVQHLWVDGLKDGSPVVGMRVRADSGGSGRPEQVIAAMGLPEPTGIHRRRLVLAETSPTHEAWRRHGRFT